MFLTVIYQGNKKQEGFTKEAEKLRNPHRELQKDRFTCEKFYLWKTTCAELNCNGLYCSTAEEKEWWFAGKTLDKQ